MIFGITKMPYSKRGVQYWVTLKDVVKCCKIEGQILGHLKDVVKCGKIRGSIRSPIIGHMVFRGPKWGAILGRGSPRLAIPQCCFWSAQYCI